MQHAATGILHLIGQTQVVSDKFSKRELVLKTDGQYPQFISFQLTQDKCALADGLRKDEEVTVHFNLRGREWADPKGGVKYFNTLEAWRVEKIQGGSAAPSTPVQAASAPVDDLPF